MDPMTPDTPPEIIPMRAEHVPAVLAIHRQAFAGYPHVALGEAYLHRMLSWYAEDSAAIGFVAVVDRHVVGYAVGTDRAGATRLSTHVRSKAVMGMVRRPWLLARTDVASALLRRLLPSRSAWAPELGANLFSLVSIGVTQSFRRTGSGHALLRAFEGEAARRGADVLTLSVEPENAGARALYESNGWQPADERAGRVLTYHKHLDRTTAPPATS